MPAPLIRFCAPICWSPEKEIFNQRAKYQIFSMKPFTQTNKLILAILIIVIIGAFGWLIYPLLFPSKQSSTNTNVSQNQNSNTTNINVANTNTQPTNLNASVDTSNWKTYRNEELNLVFSYPEVFGEVLSTRKTKLNDPAVRSGES